MEADTKEPTPEPLQNKESVLLQTSKRPSVSISVSVILASLFGASQGISAIQDFLDTRYSKREELTRTQTLSEEILRRLDRIEKKLDQN